MFQENMIYEDYSNLTLAEIVTRNFRAAAVFEKYNLDFCCRGDRQIDTACNDLGLDTKEIISELYSITNDRIPEGFNPDKWQLDFLIDYIMNTHHQYVRTMIPVISAHADKVALVHGKNHPETKEIARIWSIVYKDLRQHMMKEEEILFPFVKRLVNLKQNGSKYEAPYFKSVQNPITAMEAEHQSAGDELYSIRIMTNNYTLPADACNTYQVLYKELKDFEEDLHKHIHLENNLLFPKAIALEAAVSLRTI
jgi:regulator of cell morphogenesis and NO signaling